MRGVWGVCASVALACSASQPTLPSVGTLSSQDAAAVGQQLISVQEVQGVMQAQKLTPHQALDALVKDSRLAQHWLSASSGGGAARSDVTDQDPTRRRVLSRRVLEAIYAQARATPPTDAEIATYTERHWWELDRPASVRVSHAVVVCNACPQRERAEQLAEQIHTAVQATQDLEAFKAAAGTVKAKGLEVRVEDLPLVASDGRVIELDKAPGPGLGFGELHEQFAQAANRLTRPGEISGVVESPSGFHVIRLTERLGELRPSKEERRNLLSKEIWSARAKAVEQAQLAEAAKAWPTQVSRSFAADTELLVPR
jgi:hypothetical protein